MRLPILTTVLALVVTLARATLILGSESGALSAIDRTFPTLSLPSLFNPSLDGKETDN